MESRSSSLGLAPPNLGRLGDLGTQGPEAPPTEWWQRLAPESGWLALGLLALAQLTVVWSVVAAAWVKSYPPLEWMVLSALATALVMVKLRGNLGARLLAGIPIGVIIVGWQMAALSQGEGMEERLADFYNRMAAWVEVAKTGGVSRDVVPFLFMLVGLSWLMGYVGGWSVLLWKNPWGGLVPAGVAILVNLSYLPGRYTGYFLLFLFWALLLVMRLNLVKQEREWLNPRLFYQKLSEASFLFHASLLGALLVGFAWVLPVSEAAPKLNEVWDEVSRPWRTLEREFERLFGALAPSKAIQLHDFEKSFAFKGGLDLRGGRRAAEGSPGLSENLVMYVTTKTPKYLRGRSYDFYSGQGWQTREEMTQALGGAAGKTPKETFLLRQEAEYTIEVAYPTDILFAPGQPRAVNKATIIETPKPPELSLDLEDPRRNRLRSPQLRAAVRELAQAVSNPSRLLTPEEVARLLPPDVQVVRVSREGLRIKGLEVVVRGPDPPDILALRSRDRLLRAEKYTVTSSISVAPVELLQAAGEVYPTWVSERFLQLPPGFPERVRTLARDLTASAATPYAKAKEIERHVRSFPYTLDVEAPPGSKDGVEYFLFDAKRGYSDYHASAMVVMLRAVGVPARLGTGYVAGDYHKDRGLYVVRERHGHAWPEVYFPQYGWMEFEPTPSLPEIFRDETLDLERLRGIGGGDDDEQEGYPEGEAPPVETAQGGSAAGVLWSALGYLAGLLVALALMAYGGRLLWLRGLRGLELAAQAYAKVCRLAGLTRVGGPRTGETPQEYARRLGGVVIPQAEEVSLIAEGYTRTEYGKKRLAPEEQSRIVGAWQTLRGKLLLLILRWK